MYRRSTPRANIVALLVGFLVILALLAACSKPASSPTPQPPKPTPVPAASPAPKPSPTTAAPKPPTTAAPKANPLAQIIEGAKKEGTVSVTLMNSYMTPQTKQRIEKELKDKYGVSLDVKITAISRMAQQLADTIMEYKTGATHKYDIMSLDSDYIGEGMKAGVLDDIDWKPFLAPGTPLDVLSEVPGIRGRIVYQTGLNGLQYNPQKVAANEVPKTISDLANPKWKGKLGVLNYTAHWSRWAFILGKDKTVATLKAIMKNQPALGTYADLSKRYLLGETVMTFTTDAYLSLDRNKGMPAEWQSLDFVDVMDNSLVLLKKAPHPNAAKLVAIYLAGPDGVKVTTSVYQGNRFYPGNPVNDIVQQAKKQNISMYPRETFPGYMSFYGSKGYEDLLKEIDLILKGG